MRKEVIEILAQDLELKTIFAKGVSGSIVLDIIPAAVSYLKVRPEFEQIYVQDTTGVEFVIPQGYAVEQAVQNWKSAKNGGLTVRESMVTERESVDPDRFLFL